ncbi:MAG: hypothetical protein HYX72_09640 [Acidobacteria bacterium]|nr:hypothetical protein [Acidobacteriota bacterium]
MIQPLQSRRRVGFIGILATIGVVTAAVLFQELHTESHPMSLRKPTGFPQLIAYERFRGLEGEMCQWTAASGETTLVASLQQQQTPAGGFTGQADPSAGAIRPPLRVIRDPYSNFASIAVDAVRNEVVLTDENMFNILVYDRLTNTPPKATMSEPKRRIGGLDTKVEFQCGLYIDPVSGDIYAVNNDTMRTLVIFSRKARGNVPPDRELYTPHGTFGIAVDEEAQELFLTVQHDSAVVVYNKMAEREDSPIRVLQGDRTLLADPHGIALDTKNNLMFVTNFGYSQSHTPGPDGRPIHGGTLGAGRGRELWPLGWDDTVPGSGKFSPPSITVYDLKASGNTAPVRVISGPQFNWPTGLSFDPQRNELFVANDAGNSVLVFDASASGDVAPLRVIKGPKSLIKNPTGVFVDVKNDELWVSNFGSYSATVYKRTASGDTAPLRIIRSAPAGKSALMIGNPGALAFDSKREEILVPN